MSKAVVIIDLASSVSRGDAWSSLKGVAALIRPQASLAQVVWGDEVEAVVDRPTDLWSLYITVRQFLLEPSFYMGVGFGDVVAEGVSGEIHELNGTAFKAARQAIDWAKGEPKKEVALSFSVYGEHDLTRALNAFVETLNISFACMTPQQVRYMRDFLIGLRQTAIAQRHHVTQPAVHKVLARGGSAQVACVREGLGALVRATGHAVGWGGERP